MKIPCLVAAYVVFVSVLCVGSSAAQKPVTTLIIHASTAPAPASTELLWASADAVVAGRVVGNTVRETRIGSGSADPTLGTEYRFRVTDVLKQSEEHQIAGNVAVLLPGGVKEYPDRVLVYKQEGFPPFDQQASVVLFLRWSPSAETYIPLSGPDGVFVESDGLIRSPGRSTMARGNVGKSADRFREELRAIGKSKKSLTP